jgi:hypothetical protein
MAPSEDSREKLNISTYVTRHRLHEKDIEPNLEIIRKIDGLLFFCTMDLGLGTDLILCWKNKTLFLRNETELLRTLMGTSGKREGFGKFGKPKRPFWTAWKNWSISQSITTALLLASTPFLFLSSLNKLFEKPNVSISLTDKLDTNFISDSEYFLNLNTQSFCIYADLEIVSVEMAISDDSNPTSSWHPLSKNFNQGLIPPGKIVNSGFKLKFDAPGKRCMILRTRAKAGLFRSSRLFLDTLPIRVWRRNPTLELSYQSDSLFGSRLSGHLWVGESKTSGASCEIMIDYPGVRFGRLLFKGANEETRKFNDSKGREVSTISWKTGPLSHYSKISTVLFLEEPALPEKMKHLYAIHADCQ